MRKSKFFTINFIWIDDNLKMLTKIKNFLIDCYVRKKNRICENFPFVDSICYLFIYYVTERLKTIANIKAHSKKYLSENYEKIIIND